MVIHITYSEIHLTWEILFDENSFDTIWGPSGRIGNSFGIFEDSFGVIESFFDVVENSFDVIENSYIALYNIKISIIIEWCG